MENLNIYSPPVDDDNFESEEGSAVKYGKPEEPEMVRYTGFGRLHYIKNARNKKFTWSSHIYSICVKGVGRGNQNLIFTDEEIERAAQRASDNKDLVVQPNGLWQIILSGELGRLF